MPEPLTIDEGPEELDSAGQPRNVITDRYAPPGSAERLGHPLTLVALDEVERRRRRQHRRRLLECLVALAVIVLVGLALAHRAGARVDWQRSTASVFDARAEPRLGCWPYAGAKLSATALVVAHRSIPCGTRLRVCARRCLTLTVRDRGPYIAGRELDIDELAQRRMGFVYGVGPVRWRQLP